MILCVTLNPCLDKTLTVPGWRPGDSVRGQEIRQVVGGKGNNVARALVRLGREARPATFLGGPIGALCEQLLRQDDQLEPLVVRTEAPTRTILTVRTESTAEQTAFFDPDPQVSQAEAEALYRAVEETISDEPVEGLSLSGSSPSPATHGLYSDLIALAQTRKLPVFLDTYGPALEAVWGFWPTAIQLNRREASAHLRHDRPTDADLFAMLERWSRRGVRLAIVTDGPNPALVLCDGQRFRASPPTVQTVNPIGSGDCLLAGLIDGTTAGLAPEPLIRHGMACAVANALVWDAGAIDPDEVRRQEANIRLEPVSRG